MSNIFFTTNCSIGECIDAPPAYDKNGKLTNIIIIEGRTSLLFKKPNLILFNFFINIFFPNCINTANPT